MVKATPFLPIRSWLYSIFPLFPIRFPTISNGKNNTPMLSPIIEITMSIIREINKYNLLLLLLLLLAG